MTPRKKKKTHDLVNPKDRPDVHTGVDIAAPVEWVKHDAVLPLVFILDDHRVFEFLRDEHCGLSGGAEGVDHDIVREHVELLLLFALDVGVACQPNAADDNDIRSWSDVDELSGTNCGRRRR